MSMSVLMSDGVYESCSTSLCYGNHPWLLPTSDVLRAYSKIGRLVTTDFHSIPNEFYAAHIAVAFFWSTQLGANGRPGSIVHWNVVPYWAFRITTLPKMEQSIFTQNSNRSSQPLSPWECACTHRKITCGFMLCGLLLEKKTLLQGSSYVPTVVGQYKDTARLLNTSLE